jgi:protoporphyrinogen oxidase
MDAMKPSAPPPPPPPPLPRVRVAVVGTGLAGLLSAHLLRHDPRDRFAVRLFESGSSLSLDSASVSIPNAARTASDRVDLPMRAFAGGFYSNLRALYDHLGVRYHQQPFVFHFTSDRPRPRAPYFIHPSNLHQLPPRPSTVGLLPFLLETTYLLVCYLWFSLCCFLLAPRPAETLHHYLVRAHVPRRFVNSYLLPLISSVTTCPHDSLLASPASDLVTYKRKTNAAPHYTVADGVSAVQARLADGLQHELGALVTAVVPQADGVKVSWKPRNGTDAQIQTEHFDRVILAVAPDVVGQVFEPLRHYMESIPTALVESVVHSDYSVLGPSFTAEPKPTQHAAHSIYLNTSTEDRPKSESHHIQPCGAIVTTCPFTPIDPSLVIHSAKFTRVLRSTRSQRIVNAIFGANQTNYGDDKSVPQWRNGHDNVWLVGGWCWDGMVLLEGCVVSATRVADAFGVDVPWRHEPKHSS